MKPFQFKQFTIQQAKSVFRVGTDGVLLGSLASVEKATRILEVGTGTGLISLMLAQRNSTAQIDAIDINENAVQLAKENFENSPFNKRLKVNLQDFKHYVSSDKFDSIVSNPPYFEENNSTKDIAARQQTELSFEMLIEKSANYLSEVGLLSVIIPFEAGIYFEKICESRKLHLVRKFIIYGIENSKPKRLLLEFSLQKKQVIISEFTIEKSPRKYTEEYLKLTEDFHQFNQ